MPRPLAAALFALTVFYATLYSDAEELSFLPIETAWDEGATLIEESFDPLDHCHLGLWTDWQYLVAWRSSSKTPPLVTTSPNNGVLPQAQVLFGHEPIGGEARPGGRLTIGGWLDDSLCWAIEGRLLMLGKQSVRFADDSNNTLVLARPFLNMTPLGGGIVGEDAIVIASPGFASGSISITNESNVLVADVCFRRLLFECPGTEVDLTAGYVASRIDGTLRIGSSSTLLAGTVLDVLDQFDTKNEYHAGHIGFCVDSYNERWSLRLKGQVALGNMRQVVRIRGSQTSTAPAGAPVVTVGGLFAQSTNIGNYRRDRFVVSPEVDLNLGYRIHDSLELTVGYMILSWNRVVQPGNQIDSSVSGPPAVGTQRPGFNFREGQYVVHGLTLGLHASF